MPTHQIRGSDGNIHLVDAPLGVPEFALQRFVENQINPPQPVVIPEPEDQRGDFSRGFGSVWPQSKALVGGTLGLLGNTMEEAGVPFGLGEGLRQYGMDVYERNMAEAQKGAKPTDDFVAAYEKFRNEGDFGGLLDSVQYWSGYGAGQALETIALSALGSLAGGVGAGLGFEKQAAKGLIDKAITRMAGELVDKSGGKLAVEEAKSMAMKQLAAKATTGGSEFGQAAALYANAAAQELGSVYGEAGKEGPIGGNDLAKVWAFGTAAALLEGAMDKFGINQVMAAGKAIPRSELFLNAARQVGIGMGREGLTEAAQTGLERAGAGQSLTDEAAIRDYINSAVAGAIGGGQAGLIAGGTQALRRKPEEAPPGEAPPATPPTAPAPPVAPPVPPTGVAPTPPVPPTGAAPAPPVPPATAPRVEPTDEEMMRAMAGWTPPAAPVTPPAAPVAPPVEAVVPPAAPVAPPAPPIEPFHPDVIAQRVDAAVTPHAPNMTAVGFANRIKTELPKVLGNPEAAATFLAAQERSANLPNQKPETRAAKQAALAAARQIIDEHEAPVRAAQAVEAQRVVQEKAAAEQRAAQEEAGRRAAAQELEDAAYQKRLREMAPEEDVNAAREAAAKQQLILQQQRDAEAAAAKAKADREEEIAIRGYAAPADETDALAYLVRPRRSLGTAEGTPGHAPGMLTSRVADILGPRAAGRLMGGGKLRVITRAQAQQISNEDMTRTRGFYNPKDGVSYLVAENIPTNFTNDRLHGLLRHELGVHALTLGRGSKGWQSILDQIDRMVKVKGSKAAAAHAMAKKALAATGNKNPSRETLLEETAGYIVETMPTASIARRIIAWFKAALGRLGMEHLNEKDITALAQSALRHGTPEMREGLGEKVLRTFAGPGAAQANREPYAIVRYEFRQLPGDDTYGTLVGYYRDGTEARYRGIDKDDLAVEIGESKAAKLLAATPVNGVRVYEPVHDGHAAFVNAVQRVSAGEDPEVVRQETGWFQGIWDGMWRFEISDKDAKFKPALTVEQAFEAWKKDVRAGKRGMWSQDELRNLDKFDPDTIIETLHEEYINRPFGPLKENVPVKLGDVFDHDVLYEAYPKARDIKIELTDKTYWPDSQGEFSPADNKIILSPSRCRSALSTLIHEIQHWIQEQEGFARGGSHQAALSEMTDAQRLRLTPQLITQVNQAIEKTEPYVRAFAAAGSDINRLVSQLGPLAVDCSNAEHAYRRAAIQYPDMHPEVIAARRLWEANDDEMALALFGKPFDDLLPVEKTAADTFIKQGAMVHESGDNLEAFVRLTHRKEKNKLEAAFKTLTGLVAGDQTSIKEAVLKYGDGYYLYHRVAGEAEARLAEARKDYNEQDLRDIPPYEGTDVSDISPEDIIVITWDSYAPSASVLQSNAAAFDTPDVNPAPSVAADSAKFLKRIGDAANHAMNNAGSQQQRVYAVDQFLRNVADFIKSIVFQSLPIHAIVDLAQKYIPQAREVLVLFRQHAGALSGIHQEMGELVHRAHTWARGNPERVKKFNYMVYEGTKLKVDLTRPPNYYRDVHADMQRQRDYEALKKIYDSDEIGDTGRAIYRMMRATYDRLYNELVDQIENNVKTTTGREDIATALKKDFYAQLTANGALEGYAPMWREGDHILSYVKTIPNYHGAAGRSPEPHFEMFETAAERNRRADELRNDPDVDQATLKTPVKFDTTVFADTPPLSFVGKVLGKLREAKVDEDTIMDICRIAIQMSPQNSLARMVQGRREVEGYRDDAFGAYERTAISMRRRLVNLKYGAQFRKLRTEIKEQGMTLDARTQGTGGMLANELMKRLDFASSPNVPRWQQIIKTLTYGWTLGFNVSSALIDSAAVPMVFYPLLKANHPGQNVGRAFSQAMRLYMGSKRSHNVETYLTAGLEGAELAAAQEKAGITGRDVSKVDGWYSMANYDYSQPDLSPELKRLRVLADVAKRMGQIHRMSKFDNLETLGEKVNTLDKINNYQGILMQGSERMRREVGMIAAYNLELEKVAKGREPTELEMQAAANKAINFIEETSGGTSLLSSPRFAQTPIGGILFMYKRYGATMYYMQFKMLRDMLKGETPEIRKAAKQQAVLTMITSAAFAGVQGMPMIGVVAALYNMFKDDEDDEWDIMMRKHVNPLFYEGAVNYFANTDVSSRIGLTNMLWRSDPANQDKTPIETVVTTLGGPTLGMIDRFGRGVKLIEQGYIERGIESLLPAALSNVFKSIRYATEGTRTLRGDPVTGEVNPFNVVTQAIGFAPADYLREQQKVSFLKRMDKTVAEKRNKLLEKLFTASRMGDTDEIRALAAEVQEFNKVHREHPITGKTLTASFRQRMKSSAQMIAGRLPDARRRQIWLDYDEAMKDDLADDLGFGGGSDAYSMYEDWDEEE